MIVSTVKSVYRWLVTALVCCMLVAASGPAFALERETVDGETVYRLRLAETWPPDFPIFHDAVASMVDMSEKMSGGRLQFTIHARDVHERPLGVFDMVKAGEYDMGHSASYYWKDKDPTTMFFTTVPFGMTAPEQYAWFYYGGGMELMQQAYAKHNMLSFPGGNTGNQMGGWFRKDIAGLDDLQGLRMRIPGFAGEVLAELGIEPTNIPAGDLYEALSNNTIDALEWVGPAHDLRMGFQEIAPYYYTGWHEPATELQFLVNLQTWEALPGDLQEILRVAMRTAAYDMYAQSYHESAENWDTIMTEYPNIIVRTLPQTVLVEMQKANDRLLREMARDDPEAARIIQSQQEYLDLVRAWTDISDRAYAPIAEYLSEATGRTFVYEYPDNPLSYWQDLQQDKYDIVFDESHFTSWMILNHQHLPLVKVSGALIYVYYIDNANDALDTLDDLAGGTVCGQSPPNQGTLALYEQFDNPFRIPHLVPFEGWERIFEAVSQGECTVGIAPLQLFDQLNSGAMHPLYMTRPVPNQTFAAGRRLSPQLKSRITAALLSEAGHQATASLRDLYNIAGFERAFEVEYIGHDKVLTENYRFDFVSQ